MSPDAYTDFKLNTQSGNAQFTAALMASLGEANGTVEASLGGAAIARSSWPSDVYVFPLNTAIAAQAIYKSKKVASKTLDILIDNGLSFQFNGVLVKCNATLAPPPTLRSSSMPRYIKPVTVVQAVIKADMTTLGMAGFEGYGDVTLALRVVAHSLLGQAGKTLSDVVLRPSPDNATESEVLFTFTDEVVGKTFEQRLAEKGVELRWNKVTYMLQPQSGLLHG